MSMYLTAGLVLAYVVLVAVTAVERRWPVCMYWVGAVIVTVGILWMGYQIGASK